MASIQFVRVRNVGEKPINIMWNSVSTIIKPGGEGIVNWEAACKDFGNPFAVNDPTRNVRDRAYEWERICVLYGVYGDTERIEENFPRVECFDAEGNRIYMLFEDPEGERAPDSKSEPADTPVTMDQLSSILTELAALRQRVALIDATDTGVNSEPTGDPNTGAAPASSVADVTEDKPTNLAPTGAAARIRARTTGGNQ